MNSPMNDAAFSPLIMPVLALPRLASAARCRRTIMPTYLALVVTEGRRITKLDIAIIAGLSEHSVRHSIAALEAAGIVTSIGGGETKIGPGSGRIYTLVPEKIPQDLVRTSANASRNAATGRLKTRIYVPAQANTTYANTTYANTTHANTTATVALAPKPSPASWQQQPPGPPGSTVQRRGHPGVDRQPTCPTRQA